MSEAKKDSKPVKMVRARARTKGFLDLRGDCHPREVLQGDIVMVPEALMANRWLEPVLEEPAAAEPAKTGAPPSGGQSVI